MFLRAFYCQSCNKVIRINLSNYIDYKCIDDDRGIGEEIAHTIYDCEVK